MSQIVLDAEAFKALSSDTRLHILKALDARRLTVSELGRLLGLNKATVFEHLQQLAKADLVKKDDEGRKWVYYKLTWKGKNVLHPENVQFMLLLSTAVLSVGGVVAQVGRLLDWWGGKSTSQPETLTRPEPTVADRQPQVAPAAEGDASSANGAAAPSSAPELQPEADASPVVSPKGPSTDLWHDPNFWLLIALAVLLVAVAIFAWRYIVQRRRERAPILERLAGISPEPDEPQA